MKKIQKDTNNNENTKKYTKIMKNTCICCIFFFVFVVHFCILFKFPVMSVCFFVFSMFSYFCLLCVFIVSFSVFLYFVFSRKIPQKRAKTTKNTKIYIVTENYVFCWHVFEFFVHVCIKNSICIFHIRVRIVRGVRICCIFLCFVFLRFRSCVYLFCIFTRKNEK